MKNAVLVLAAGSGTRYKGKKQDIIFHNKPLWKYPYDTALKVVDKDYVIVVGKDIKGGTTRTGSVINGLKALPEDTDRVVIIEAARPLLTSNDLLLLFNHEYPSISYVKPLVNTVVFKDGTYINRNELYEMLTPQAFDYKLLLEAYNSGRFSDMTDETRVMYEYHGIKPFFIETQSQFFKVTYPGDLEVLESIYKQGGFND